jgi:hypothetical protein
MKLKPRISIPALAVILCCGFALFWYLHEETGSGIVASKWIETSMPGNCKKTCSPTLKYFVQLENGRIFDVLFDRLQWDGLITGQQISYSARGFDIRPLGVRIAVPTMFWFKVLEP